MAKIKFMGLSDVHRLNKGETFGGQLQKEDALDQDLVWSWDNDHLIDTADLGLSDEVLALILEQPEFKDVTDLKRIPLNEAQRTWRGQTQSEIQAVNESGTTESDKGKTTRTSGVGAGAGAGGTTVGGSTSGSTGGGTP